MKFSAPVSPSTRSAIQEELELANESSILLRHHIEFKTDGIMPFNLATASSGRHSVGIFVCWHLVKAPY